jgi:fumarylacetoacetase
MSGEAPVFVSQVSLSDFKTVSDPGATTNSNRGLRRKICPADPALSLGSHSHRSSRCVQAAAVFSTPQRPAQVGVRIGDRVLAAGEAAARLRPEWASLLATPSLNPLMAAGPGVWAAVRGWLQELLTDRDRAGEVRLAAARLRLPFAVADFVDFYASLDHARNVGKILRPGTGPLSANWRHLPVGYHGRLGLKEITGTIRPARTTTRPPG